VLLKGLRLQPSQKEDEEGRRGRGEEREEDEEGPAKDLLTTPLLG
jgi:hypothetical protein